MTRTGLLERLRRAWRGRWLGMTLVAGAAAGVATATLLMRLGWEGAPGMTAAWTATLVTLGWLVVRRPMLTRSTVARHLNRTFPEAEESADLLVDDPADLTPVGRLQRSRVERRLEDAGAGNLRVPGVILRAPLLTALLAAAAAAGAWLWPADMSPEVTSEADDESAPAAPVIAAFGIRVVPPGYVGGAPYSTGTWDLEVPEGAEVEWRLTLANADPGDAWLHTADGDSMPFAPDPADGAQAILTATARHSLIYRVQIQSAVSGLATATPLARLLVRPDLPPTVAITRPEERTTLTIEESWTVALEAVASDDHGLGEAVLVATVASGYGEGVSFRELRRPVGTVRRPDQRSLRLRDMLDLRAMGLEPGDEVYVAVAVTDSRQPAPQTVRSETVVIAIEDTTTIPLSDVRGLAVDRMPDYFRSQRQIILDTERLLADRDTIGRRTFEERSQHIGFDQHLLRLRYSELVGDEFEDTPLGFTEEDAAEAGFESLVPEEPTPEDPPVRESGEEETAEDPAEEMQHDHDDPENATRLAQTVKTILKASLSQMWEAEVRLRTNRPAEALPYEERALEYLKQVQQAARAYVLRTGFEPAPLDETSMRLTGDLTGLSDATRQQSVGTLPQQEIRDALEVVRAERTGFRVLAGDGRVARLERGGAMLARMALQDPVSFLEPVGALRELIDSIAAGGSCANCLDTAESGLLLGLPESVPFRTGGTAAARGTARRYFEELERVR